MIKSSHFRLFSQECSRSVQSAFWLALLQVGHDWSDLAAECPHTITSCQILWISTSNFYKPWQHQPSAHNNTVPSGYGSWYHFFKNCSSRDSYFQQWGSKCTALLHSKAVINVLPILIDDGQLSSTSLTCPMVHPRNSRQSSSQSYCWTPPSHENNVVYVGLVIILPFTKQLRTLTSQDTPGYKETWDKEEKREEWEMWIWHRVQKAIGMPQRQELESKTRAGGGWLAPGGTPDWSWHTQHLVNGLPSVVVKPEERKYKQALSIYKGSECWHLNDDYGFKYFLCQILERENVNSKTFLLLQFQPQRVLWLHL